MKTKNLIRTAVLAALFAWPGIETYRYFVAQQQLTASEQLRTTVEEHYQIARLNSAQVAKNNNGQKAISNRP